MQIENKRNIALVGHNSCGKTTLAEAMLYSTGAIDRMGTVEQGNTVSDFDGVEIHRQTSIYTSSIIVDYEGHRITILDTPGFSDFVAEVITATKAVDAVVEVIDGAAGIEVQTLRTWQTAKSYEKPIICFVNRLDRERADFIKTVNSLKKTFEEHIVPIQLPLGKETNFKGVIDLLKNKAYVYRDNKGNFDEADIPDDMKDEVEKYRTEVIESIVETDESLMDRYLNGEEIKGNELAATLKKAIANREFVPVFCGAALPNIGVTTFLQSIVDLIPSPKDMASVKAEDLEGNPVELKASEDEGLCALVFKTMIDPYIGKMNYIRIYSGVLNSNGQFYNVSKNVKEKVSHFYLMTGKKQMEIDKATPGDIIAIAKLKETSIGDILVTEQSQAVTMKPFDFPEPMISRAVYTRSKGDETKLSTGLSRLAEGDPTFRWEYDPETGETVISGMGDIHISIIVEKMKENFGVELEVGRPKIAYRETVKKKAVGEHKHKKQTGGHGQYGHVKIEVEPLPRGKGFEFVDKIVGGAIPRNFIPSAEKGIREALKEGVLAKYPVMDVRVTLFDGSYHEVDSSDISFQIAGLQAFKKAMQQAKPVLLEPVMEVSIYCPEENMGDVMGDLNGRRGRILGMDSAPGGQKLIRALVPLAEMLEFSPQLNSLTSGRGYFTMKFNTYEEAPAKISEEIIKRKQQEKEEK